MIESALVWSRRDLRLSDQAALSLALHSARRVYCVFVFDSDILSALVGVGQTYDRRVEFMLESVRALRVTLRALNGELIILHGKAAMTIPSLASRLSVDAVSANRDYEPDAQSRDRAVLDALSKDGRTLVETKDHVIFERHEIISTDGLPFRRFSAYARMWRQRLGVDDLGEHVVEDEVTRWAAPPPHLATELPTLTQLGFAQSNLAELGIPIGAAGGELLLRNFLPRMADYASSRDFPGQDGTSQLSMHIRFGTVSIRRLVRCARERPSMGADAWLQELIWREYFQMLLAHQPELATEPFLQAFRGWRYLDDAAGFEAWCTGQTGYPMVDAGMRQLVQTGFMHNRARMVCASFLSKHLLIDWRLGERFFARHLNDYDLASNCGNWQWAASVGCDAQPYFRIFNPEVQSRRFDPEGHYLRRYLPELADVPNDAVHAPWKMSRNQQSATRCLIGRDYPAPIVDHQAARERALSALASVSKSR